MDNLRIFSDTTVLTRAAAEAFTAYAEEAIAINGVFRVALSGGSTPLALYALLADPAYRQRIAWEQVHVFWGDERCVPPDHTDSNYRKAHEILLSRVPVTPENVHRIHAELPPEQAAAAYEEGLLAYFTACCAGNLPDGFDLALLGMGADGHTASLFPGNVQALMTMRWVMASPVEKLSAWRITLTPALLNRSRRTLFLVSGADKSEALQRVLFGAHQPERYPAQAIRPTSGVPQWMVDEAAARLF